MNVYRINVYDFRNNEIASLIIDATNEIDAFNYATSYYCENQHHFDIDCIDYNVIDIKLSNYDNQTYVRAIHI